MSEDSETEMKPKKFYAIKTKDTVAYEEYDRLALKDIASHATYTTKMHGYPNTVKYKLGN